MQTEAKISPEKLLAEGKTIQIKPQGYSMYPLFVPGRDSAVIAPAEQCGGQSAMPRYHKGDVVLYRGADQKLTLHRICRCKKEQNGSRSYYMAGDSQSRLEGPIYPEQIKGVLVAVIRKEKKFTVKHPVYRAAFAVWRWLRPVRPQIAGAVAGFKRKHACRRKKV